MSSSSTATYVLGDAEPEVRRLGEQSDLFAPATEDGLARAGIGVGMHVLDVGAGAGGVSLLAARLVGPQGSVTALDSSPAMLDVTRSRAAVAGLDTVTTLLGDLEGDLTGQYDVVAGRLVLVHLSDPLAALRRLVDRVRPGGIVVFAEFTMSLAGQRPSGPLFTDTLARVVDTFRLAGRPVDLGLELPRLLRQVGLVDVRAQAAGLVAAPDDAAVYGLLASTSESLLPLSELVGAVAPGVVDSATLRDRLLAEAQELDAVAVPPLLVTAWGRVPARHE